MRKIVQRMPLRTGTVNRIRTLRQPFYARKRSKREVMSRARPLQVFVRRLKGRTRIKRPHWSVTTKLTDKGYADGLCPSQFSKT